MKVLFAIKDESGIVRAIERKFKQEEKKFNHTEVTSFTAIIKELQKNSNYDRIVIDENLDEKLKYTKSNKNVALKALNKIMNLGEKSKILFMVNDKSDINDLVGLGVYNIIIGKDQTKKKIYEMLSKPNNKSSAIEMYTDSKKKKSEKVSEKAKNEKNNESVKKEMSKTTKAEKESSVDLYTNIRYLNREDVSDEKRVRRFNNLSSKIDNISMGILIKSLSPATRKVLKKNSKIYNEIMGYPIPKSISADSSKSKAVSDETTVKRRGRPRKVTSESEPVSDAPKKRGRPRKTEIGVGVAAVGTVAGIVAGKEISSEKNKAKKKSETKMDVPAKKKKIVEEDDDLDLDDFIYDIDDEETKTDVKETNKKKKVNKKDNEFEIEDDDEFNFDDEFDIEDDNKVDLKNDVVDDEFDFDIEDDEDNSDIEDDEDFDIAGEDDTDIADEDNLDFDDEDDIDIDEDEEDFDLEDEDEEDLDLEDEDEEDLDLEDEDEEDLDLEDEDEEDFDLEDEDEEDFDLEDEDEEDLDLEDEDEEDLDLEDEDEEDLDLEDEDEEDLDLEDEDEEDLDLEDEDEEDLDLEDEDEEDLDLEDEDEEDLDLEDEDEEDLDLEDEDEEALDLDDEEDEDLDLEDEDEEDFDLDEDEEDIENDDDILNFVEDDDLDLEEDKNDGSKNQDSNDDVDLLDFDLDEDSSVNEIISSDDEQNDILNFDDDDNEIGDIGSIDSFDDVEQDNDNDSEGVLDIDSADDDIVISGDSQEDDDDIIKLDDDSDDDIIKLDDDDLISLNDEKDELKIDDIPDVNTASGSAFSGIQNKNYNPNYNISKQLNEINENDESDEVMNIDQLDVRIAQGQKVAAFVGGHGNGTSFIVNNLANLLAEQGINVAILDATKNRNSYYIYTENQEGLRSIAFSCFEKLDSGIADGIKVGKNLTVYTTLPNSDGKIEKMDIAMNTILGNHSLVLIDCDTDSDAKIFSMAQEIYLVQSLDILTMQPLTSLVKKLKMNNILDESKLRVLINKDIRVNELNDRILISALSVYNSPDTTYQLDLFNRDTIQYLTIPFEERNYAKYLGEIARCKLRISGYSKALINSFNKLAKMVYPIGKNKSK